jgi:AcrR family transcriptional regulator
LVLAYLRQELDQWRGRAERLDQPDRPAEERVELLFTALAASVDDTSFYGCPFINAVIDRPEDPAIGQVVADYRRAFTQHRGTLTGAPANDLLVGHPQLL